MTTITALVALLDGHGLGVGATLSGVGVFCRCALPPILDWAKWIWSITHPDGGVS